MAAITYGAHAPVHHGAVGVETTATGRGLLARFWDALIEAQMKRAMREIRMHRHLLPADLEIAGNRISYKNEDQLPFVRARD